MEALNKWHPHFLLQLLIEVLHTDHLGVLDSLHGHSREGFLILINSVSDMVYYDQMLLTVDGPRLG